MKYEVIPRYSGGSPAMVDERTALRVAEDEKRGFKMNLEGAYGEHARCIAEREKLEGIVLVSKGGAKYLDMITERDYEDMPYGAIRWPDKLYCLRKRGLETCYFRREPLAQTAARRRGSHPADASAMMVVLRALEARWGIDIRTVEAERLWRGLVVIE